MKKIKIAVSFLAIIVCAAIGFARDYYEDYTSKDIKVSAFNAIEVRGDGEVNFTQAQNHEVSLNGLASSIKATKVYVRENVLIIEYKEPFFREDHLQINVSAPTLQRISVSNEADFNSYGDFQADNLTIIAQRNGEVSLDNAQINQLKITAKGNSSVEVKNVTAQRLEAKIFDRAELDLSGQATKVLLESRSSEDIDMENLYSDDVDAFAFGRGQIKYQHTPKKFNRKGNVVWDD